MTYRERTVSIINQLAKWGVPHMVKNSGMGYVISFPWTKGKVRCDEFVFSDEPDAVETYGFIWDNNGISSMSTYEVTCKTIDLYREKIK